MAFYVGQKVVCVDAGGLLLERLNPVSSKRLLTEGDTYTVTAIRTAAGVSGIQVAEVRSPISWGFLAIRFRPVVERKTDISIFQAMLNPSREQVQA